MLRLPRDITNFTPDFVNLVTMGKIPGHSVIDKFGENPSITTATDPEDIWEGGGIYVYDTDGTAPIVSLASSSSSDTEPISIQGLDINGELVSQEITLTGDTRVALSTPLWRVFRMENEGTSDLVGNVFCYTGTGTVPDIGDPEVRAVIINGNNQTQMALYTIPKGYVGFLYRGELGLEFIGTPGTGIHFAKLQYKSRRYGKVFKIKKTITLINQGNTNYRDKRSFPDVIPDLTDIKLTVAEVSDTFGVWATFDILLVKNAYLDSWFLSAIGQS